MLSRRQMVGVAVTTAAATVLPKGQAFAASVRSRIPAHVSARGPLDPADVQPGSWWRAPFYRVASVVTVYNADLEAAVWIAALRADPEQKNLRSAIRSITRDQATRVTREVLIEHGIQGLLQPLPPRPYDDVVVRHVSRLFPELRMQRP